MPGTNKNSRLADNRYSRQILFDKIGKAGQEKLGAARVLIVGCGALGCAQAEMLSRAGVGGLRIVDRDFVEFSNLQRQSLFTEADAEDRLPKAVAAKRRIAQINSEIEVEEAVTDVNRSNVEDLMADCSLVLDGTDNFQVRYLVNEASAKHGTIWIYGAAVSSYGTTMTIIPGSTPCLKCIFTEIPDPGTSPTCDTSGVIGPIIATVAATQVSEALKILVDDRAALHGSLIQFDLWANDRQRIKLGAPDPGCTVCGARVFDLLDSEGGDFTSVLCGRNSVQITPERAGKVDLDALSDRLSRIGAVRKNAYLVRLVLDEREITIFADGRAIIKGVDDPAAARSLYARYIGS